jgi:hypothetical protein
MIYTIPATNWVDIPTQAGMWYVLKNTSTNGYLTVDAANGASIGSFTISANVAEGKLFQAQSSTTRIRGSQGATFDVSLDPDSIPPNFFASFTELQVPNGVTYGTGNLVTSIQSRGQFLDRMTFGSGAEPTMGLGDLVFDGTKVGTFSNAAIAPLQLQGTDGYTAVVYGIIRYRVATAGQYPIASATFGGPGDASVFQINSNGNFESFIPSMGLAVTYPALATANVQPRLCKLTISVRNGVTTVRLKIGFEVEISQIIATVSSPVTVQLNRLGFAFDGGFRGLWVGNFAASTLGGIVVDNFLLEAMERRILTANPNVRWS